MDATRFDHIARCLAANRLSRRAALGIAGSTVIASALARGGPSAQAQDDGTPVASPEAVPSDSTEDLLFVQGFRGGSLEPKADAPDEFTLTLNEGLGYTVYFTDRPARQYGAVPTGQFLGGFDFDEENPPNAALVVGNAEEGEDVVILELMTPVYDEATHTATYDARILGEFEHLGATLQAEPVGPEAAPQEFGAAHLFIDSCSDHSILCCDAFFDETGWQCERQYGSFGPMGFCWSFGDICCHPCENKSQSYWSDQCNSQFSDCGGNCTALYSGCW
jgi:hypothetical protein